MVMVRGKSVALRSLEFHHNLEYFWPGDLFSKASKSFVLLLVLLSQSSKGASARRAPSYVWETVAKSQSRMYN